MHLNLRNFRCDVVFLMTFIVSIVAPPEDGHISGKGSGMMLMYAFVTAGIAINGKLPSDDGKAK